MFTPAILIYKKVLDHKQQIKFAIGPTPGGSNIWSFPSLKVSPEIANSVVEPYNTVLHVSSAMKNTDCCFLFDNAALYNICYQSLAIEKPNYESINRLVAQVRGLALIQQAQA